MKRFVALGAVGVVAISIVCLAIGQPPERRGGRPNGPPPPDPILALFDTNRDGELSKTEIENAAGVLHRLDQNEDGNLTREELPRSARPEDSQRDGSQRTGDQPRPDDNQAGPRELEIDTSTHPKGTVIFRGGHETDRRDGGRPVVLIAAGLGVEPKVFRDAFSNVQPARNGRPTSDRARANKEVLMTALGQNGITSDRLDEVSNYYRYQPQYNELWTHKAAQARAIVEDGKVIKFEIIQAGSGYSSAPRVEIAGFPDVKIETRLRFGKDLPTNGRVESLRIIENQQLD